MKFRIANTTDGLRLFVVFLASIFVVYFFPRFGIPQILVKLVFLALLLLVTASKDDVFWLSWFFLIANPPGRLFGTSSGSSVFRLPLYSIAPGASFSFEELFLLLYILKYFGFSRKAGDFARYFNFIMMYGAVVFAYSWFLGMSMPGVIYAVRIYLPWFWLLIYPAYIKDQGSLLRTFRMLSPYVFVAFLLTIQAQITGEYLHSMLSGELSTRFLGDAEEKLIRATHAMHLSFIALFLSVYYLSVKEKLLSQTYLQLVAVVSTLFIFLTATRGWIVAGIILLSSFLFMGGRSFFRQITRAAVMIGIVFFLTASFYPILYFQATESLSRFMTLEALAEGDLTAEGTLGRLTDRGPVVMEVFKRSPIIGWGFSSVFMNFADVHVGNQTMLMQGGVLGFSIWMIVMLGIALSFWQLHKIYQRHKYGSAALVCLMALTATFAIHSSSMQMLGFLHTRPATHIHLAFILIAAQALNRRLIQNDLNFKSIHR